MQNANINSIVKEALLKGAYKITGHNKSGDNSENCNVYIKKDGHFYNVLINCPKGLLDKDSIRPLTKEELKQIKFPRSTPPTNPPVNLSKTSTTKTDEAHTPEIKTVELEKKKYFLGTVIGVRYVFEHDSDGTSDLFRALVKEPVRDVAIVKVWSDEDLANRPAELDASLENAKDELFEKGYFLEEFDALAGAAKTAARLMNELAHDIEYGRHGPCKECSRKFLLKVEDYLRLACAGYYRHIAKLTEINDPKCKVGVFPNDEELEDFKYANGELHLKDQPRAVNEKKEISFGIICEEDLSPEARKALREFIDKNITKHKAPQVTGKREADSQPPFGFSFAFNRKLAVHADELKKRIVQILNEAQDKDKVDFTKLDSKTRKRLIDLARKATGIKKLTLSTRVVAYSTSGGQTIIKVNVGLSR